MEFNIEMEHCSSDTFNRLNEKTIIEELNEDLCIDIDKYNMFPTDISLLTEKVNSGDYEPWSIEEVNCCSDDIDFNPTLLKFNEDKKKTSNIPDTKRNVLEVKRKCINCNSVNSKTLDGDKQIIEPKTIGEELHEDICVDKEKYQMFPTDISLLTEKVNGGDYEPWPIEENNSCSDDSDFNSSLRKFNEDQKRTSKKLDAQRNVQEVKRKLKNSNSVISKTLSNKHVIELKSRKESNLIPTKKKKKKNNDIINNIRTLINSEWSEIDFEKIYGCNPKFINLEHLGVDVKPGFKEKLILNKNTNDCKKSNKTDFVKSDDLFSSNDTTDESCLKDLPGTSCSTNLSGTSCSASLPGPSCSASLSEPSCSASSYRPPDLFDYLLPCYEPKKKQNQERKLLFNHYNKCSKPKVTVTKQDIELSSLKECIMNVSKEKKENNCDDDSQVKNTEEFVEDPDIVNPDIMYNITLNEHYQQMDLLVEKISKKPKDPMVLKECMELHLIPQIQHQPKTFTAEERLNFSKGISEWEYEIDRDNWNKIMVKRAVVFTAHAGFSIASEESLYVLADVAIDYIKKLAITMKNNFDIQSRNSFSNNIDPINNSLQEVGVAGGVIELIRHYKNDVYGRRNRLMMKCQHLQKRIDDHIKSCVSIKKQKINIKFINPREEISRGNDIKKELLKEKKSETESTSEVKTEIQPIIEDVYNETHPSNENTVTKVKVDQWNNENRKANNGTIHYTGTNFKTKQFDVLKPLEDEPFDRNVDEFNFPWDSNVSNVNNIFFDSSVVEEKQKSLKKIGKPSKEIKNLSTCKIVEEFENEFECWKATEGSSTTFK